MYFSGLKRGIHSLEETRFYDICILYLSTLGYRDISIVDGTGDGGRDVITSRQDLRIQLSVRKDWEAKINEEAEKTHAAGKRSFIYITNRVIKYQDEQEFRARKYKLRGQVEVEIHDLNRISTTLAHPGVIKLAYEAVGISISSNINATPKEVAISSLLLFSPEAHELRKNVIEANVLAWLLKNPASNIDTIVGNVAKTLPGPQVEADIKSALSKLQISHRVIKDGGGLSLGKEEEEIVSAAEREFLSASATDVLHIGQKYGIEPKSAQNLLNISIEILSRGRNFDGQGPVEADLRATIAHLKLSNRKEELFDDISKSSIARFKQYGMAIDHIFSANTFDIYKALGQKTKISVMLDASVAMPLVFALEFGNSKSRYGIAASALQKLCKEHDIDLVIPDCYINEMASHGLKALEYLETYNSLPEEAKGPLKVSENAYLSHFSHIREIYSAEGKDITLDDFMENFGIQKGSTRIYVENRISSILETHNIKHFIIGNYDEDILRQISLQKGKYEHQVLVDHDAMVCTYLRKSVDEGYILATWDGVLIDNFDGMTRVLADTPARIIDFLSMAEGADFDYDQSYELLTSLIYCDEKKIIPIAEKIESIKSSEEAFKLAKYIHDRKGNRSRGDINIEEIDYFLKNM